LCGSAVPQICYRVGDPDQCVTQDALTEPVALAHHHADDRIVSAALVLHGLVQGRVERITLRTEFHESLLLQGGDQLVRDALEGSGFEVTVRAGAVEIVETGSNSPTTSALALSMVALRSRSTRRR